MTQIPSSSGQAACRSLARPSNRDEAPMKSELLAEESEELSLESELEEPERKQ